MVVEFDDKIGEAGEMEMMPLEYVIHLGAHGSHVLFDNERIKEAFNKREEVLTDLGASMVTEVREAINEVISIPDFEGKKDYISSLNPELQDVLIHLYFQMVEKTLLLNTKQLH